MSSLQKKLNFFSIVQYSDIRLDEHNIIKQCAFVHVGHEIITMRLPQRSANSDLIWVCLH